MTIPLLLGRKPQEQHACQGEPNQMQYIYETHLHTNESSECGRTPAREYIPYYMDQGYDGIVVTDHFYGNPSYMADRSAPWLE